MTNLQYTEYFYVGGTIKVGKMRRGDREALALVGMAGTQGREGS